MNIIKQLSVVALLLIFVSTANAGRFSTHSRRLDALGNLGSSDAISYTPIRVVTNEVFKETTKTYHSSHVTWNKAGRLRTTYYNVCDVYNIVEVTYEGGTVTDRTVTGTRTKNCRMTSEREYIVVDNSDQYGGR